jgi:hypothetical protein
MSRRFNRCSDRRGAVIVEFAITAPILLLLVFGAVEFSRANMLVNTASLAATEGARTGIVPGATAAEVRIAVQRELDVLGIKESTITLDPPVLSDADQSIGVAVQVPVNAKNGYMIPRFFLGKNVTKVAALRKESLATSNKSSSKELEEIIKRLLELLKKGNSGKES